ncbi:MAG: tRNA glutamyl-Q(34) synthetase GluQRS [Eggerthellaceae bacterium]|nr:tRNA glutamyl-Q(34) synthetase GluQRS [Eggerthellaceae bacterium]
MECCADAHTQHGCTCRFAPSPTGRMHAGNIFAALVSWLLARRTGGRVLLRIEDIDTGRSKREFANGIMRDFDSLGLTWDGDALYQSTRSAAYEVSLEMLEKQGLTYPCYCTRADIHAASAPHAGEKPIYPGTCRMLGHDDRLRREEEARACGRFPSIRLMVPHENVSFEDLFQGCYGQVLDLECGDFVIRRSDGAFAYQLAVVVDDAFQHVDCVVRGCDLLSSTPQQMYLQRLLGLPTPRYAHVPVLMGPDGHRLSKRHADASLESLLEEYRTPEGIIGHIAYVSGLIPQDEPCCPDDLVDEANLESLRNRREILWQS